jgi:hypothetical protein
MLTQAASQATACMRQRFMLMDVMYMQPKSQLDHSPRIVFWQILVKSCQTLVISCQKVRHVEGRIL